MATADYYLCDGCLRKTFYFGFNRKYCEEKQKNIPEQLNGEIMVLCEKCLLSREIKIIEKESE